MAALSPERQQQIARMTAELMADESEHHQGQALRALFTLPHTHLKTTI